MTPLQLNNAQDCDLLLVVLPIFAKISDLIATEDPVLATRGSYRRLQAWCVIVAKEILRVKSFIQPNLAILSELMGWLESLVKQSAISDLADLSISENHPRLVALCQWTRSHNQLKSTDKFEMACQWLDRESEDNKIQVEITLQRVYETFQAKYPEDSLEWMYEEHTSRRQRFQPAYSVPKAAQSVYQGLLAAASCTCHPAHRYGARLFLATHRKCDQFAQDLKFDMFLSLDGNWQEAHVCFESTSTALKSALKKDHSNSSAKHFPPKLKKVTRLCAPLKSLRGLGARCLKLTVEGETLWAREPELRQSHIDLMKNPVSLEDFIKNYPNSLTEMTKRVLAVLFAHAALHLHGTRWIQADWGSSNIVFYQVSSAIPLRPYIQIRLVDDSRDRSMVKRDESTNDENVSDDDENFFGGGSFFAHPFPDLVTLAMILMQVYLGRTLQSFAEELNIEDPDTLDNNAKFAVASQIFSKYSPTMYARKFCSAIDKCLDPCIHINEDGEEIGEDMLRQVIYDEIIGPLEDELTQGRISSQDFVLNLDTEAPKLDLANWGQPIQIQPQSTSAAKTFFRQHRRQVGFNSDTKPTQQAAQAPIKYAVDEWDVDIISMSFGFTTRQQKDYDIFENALNYAYSKNKLMFAAASNNGGNHKRTYPARHENIICIYSAKENGTPSEFNPPAESGDNFSTIGEAIECAWPVSLCNEQVNPSCLAWKSGTSFATPIAAGIAAFLLQYVAETLDEIDTRLLRKPQGMKAVFKEISMRCKGLDYIAPEVHPDHLFGSTKSYVEKRLSLIIRGS
ncbi:Peptidase S8/S53, subtilisin/kexin/sedolisin, partial [Metarhizium majus ARSEF 297]